MDIAATVEPERLREIMTELVNCATMVVQRYGGMVDKFTSDGIMAVFGATMALEDHALRACLAALDIQTEAQQLAAEVERQDCLDLRLRVGLNSGQVIAGEIGSRPLGHTAVGEQVGMAQRLESDAPPGGLGRPVAVRRHRAGAGVWRGGCRCPCLVQGCPDRSSDSSVSVTRGDESSKIAEFTPHKLYRANHAITSSAGCSDAGAGRVRQVNDRQSLVPSSDH